MLPQKSNIRKITGTQRIHQKPKKTAWYIRLYRNVKFWLLLNLIIVGSYYSFEMGKEFFKAAKPEYNFQAMTNEDLTELGQQLKHEMKFREGK